MKIAVFSDIHGNDVALDAVIEDAKKERVDTYIVAGDLITDFPASNEIIDKVRNLTPYVIKGNREAYLEKYLSTKAENRWKGLQNKTLACIYDSLTKENVEYVQNLQEQLSLNLAGLTIRVVHGALDGISKCIDMENQEQLELETKKIEEQILIVGHTHVNANYVNINGKIIINDGSVGLPRYSTKAQYVIINYEEGKISIQLKEVSYDKEKLKEKISQFVGLKDTYIWMNLSYYDVLYNEDIRMQFTNEAIEQMHKRYHIEETKEEVVRYSKFNDIDDDIYSELAKKYEKYFLIKRKEWQNAIR